MLGIVAFLLFVAVLIAVYCLLLRPVLRQRAALAVFWTSIDAREAGFLARMRRLFDGLKTKLAARIVWLSGAIVALHDFIMPYVAGIDWTPITSQIPPQYIPAGLLALGILFDWLRSITNKPPAV